MERRFQPVHLSEPNKEETLSILQGIKENYQNFHQVHFTDEALQAAVDLSVRYIQDKLLPDKAIDLIDEAAAKVKIRHQSKDPLLAEQLKLEKQLNSLEGEKANAILKEDYNLEVKLKQAQKNHLKSSLLIQNINETSISTLLKEPEKHAQNLIVDVLPIMQKYGFTDLNLDIESFVEASESAQQQYTAFIKEVKKGIDENNLGTLTVEITPVSLVAPRLINVKEIGKIADYLVLMAYDFHYTGSYLTGPVAPMGGEGKVREYDINTALIETLNVVSPRKVILGIPLYGYEWETISDKPGAPTIPGSGATASNRRITEMLKSCTNCVKGFDELAQQPYIVFPDSEGYHQVYYEDEKSIQAKIGLAKEYQIAGVALWALGYEGNNLLDPLKTYKKSFDFDPSLGIIN